MEILGIGFPELVFILIVALIVMGPKDMEKTGRALGRWLNSIVTSPNWRAIKNVSKELQNMPTRWMREANMERDMEQIGKIGREIGKINPLDTLDEKYPPAGSKPVAGFSRAPAAANGVRSEDKAIPNVPAAATPKDESDSK